MTNPDLESAYRRALDAVPSLRGALCPEPGAAEFDGAALTDRDWLADRIADTGRRWDSTDRRVNATLWWYSASSTLLTIPVTLLLTAGVAPDPAPARSRCTLRPDGYLGTVRSDRALTGPRDVGRGLRAALGSVIEVLAELGGAGERALWAIATDSLGNRALDAGTALGSPAAGSALAVRLGEAIGRPLPSPRFVDVDAVGRATADPFTAPADGARRFVWRSSCCLIYETVPTQSADDPAAGEHAKCVSCPRQVPELRTARLRALLG